MDDVEQWAEKRITWLISNLDGAGVSVQTGLPQPRMRIGISGPR